MNEGNLNGKFDEWSEMMSLLRYFEIEPTVSFRNGSDLQEFWTCRNKKMEHLSGVISLRRKPMVKLIGEADFSKRLFYSSSDSSDHSRSCYRQPIFSQFRQGASINASLCIYWYFILMISVKQALFFSFYKQENLRTQKFSNLPLLTLE